MAKHIYDSRNHGGSGSLITHNYKTDPDWEKRVMKETEEEADHILEVGFDPELIPIRFLESESGPKLYFMLI